MLRPLCVPTASNQRTRAAKKWENNSACPDTGWGLLIPPRERTACFTTPAPCGGTRQKGRRRPRSGRWSRLPSGAMEQPGEGTGPQVACSASWQRSLHGAGAKARAWRNPQPAPDPWGANKLLVLFPLGTLRHPGQGWGPKWNSVVVAQRGHAASTAVNDNKNSLLNAYPPKRKEKKCILI